MPHQLALEGAELLLLALPRAVQGRELVLEACEPLAPVADLGEHLAELAIEPGLLLAELEAPVLVQNAHCLRLDPGAEKGPLCEVQGPP